LNERDEAQVVEALAIGITRERVARAFAVSVRTVARAAARERARTPPTLEELLAGMQSWEEILASPAAPARPRRSPQRRPAWMVAAERLARLEREQLDDLGDDPM
jgi:hypothetical protein